MRYSFDQFLAWYFSLSVGDEAAGLQRVWRLEAAWNWQTLPVILLILVVCGVAIGLSWVVSRQRSLLLKTCLILTRLGTLCLMGLLLIQVQFRTVAFGKPRLTLLIDTSASMSLSDQYIQKDRQRLNAIGVGETSVPRLDLVRELLTGAPSGWFRELERGFEVEVYSFDGQLHSQSYPSSDVSANASRSARVASQESFVEVLAQLRADGLATDFKTTLESLFRIEREQPSQAVILFSDGVATTHRRAALSQVEKMYHRLQVPIFSVGIGTGQSPRDLILEGVEFEPVGFAGESHPLSITLSANDHLDGPISLSAIDLRTEQTVASMTLDQLGKGKPKEALVVIPNLKAGRNDFVLTVSSAVGESDLHNNRHLIRVWGREADLHVLLLDRVPRWEYRHLKTALERDTHLTLETFLMESDPGYALEDRTALARFPENLDRYDAVILGDVDFNSFEIGFLSELEEFVTEHRGGLLLLSGKQSLESLDLTSLLAELHPALARPREEDQRVRMLLEITPEGQAHGILPVIEERALFKRLPVVYPHNRSYVLKPSALTLLRGESENSSDPALPLVLSMRYGTGLVLQHLIDDTWRWRTVDNGEFYRKLWSQTIRNLCRLKMLDQLPVVEFLTTQERYKQQETVELKIIDRKDRFAGQDSISIQLIRDQGAHQESVLLTRAEGTSQAFSQSLQNLPVGDYSLSLPSVVDDDQTVLKTRFQIVASDPEKEYQPLNDGLLRGLSQSSKGKFFLPWEIEEISQNIPRRNLTSDSETRIIPLWSRWELLLLLLCVLTGEWVLRRRAGLE